MTLQLDCSLLTALHEFGHAVGLLHESERRDRDEYVRTGIYKDMSSKGLGPFDYTSVMQHDPTWRIVSPYPIGEKSELSHGDISAIDFMYNGCSESYTAPTCIASVRMGETHVIPHSREWLLSFTAKYATPVSVAHTGDVPGECRIALLWRRSRTRMCVSWRCASLLPLHMRARRTPSAPPCAVQVRVANPDTMCFGLAASDPGVCSGRGTCTTNTPYPCVCHEGYGGADCSGSANCPSNRAFAFDDILATWRGSSIAAAVTTDFKTAGWSSLQVGRVDPPGQGAAHTDLRQVYQPSRITFHMAAMRGREPMLSFARSENDLDERDCCFFVTRNGEMWSFNDKNTDVEFKPDVFYSVMLDVDWVRQQVTLTVNGEVVGTSSFANDCSSGIQALGYYGGGWLDEVKLLCTEEEAQPMCFGLPASDLGVCSGHGECTTNLVTPCVCDAGYHGLDCSMFPNCPSSMAFTFDQGLGMWISQSVSGVTTEESAAGGRSLQVGEVGSSVQGVAYVHLTQAYHPRRITFYMAARGGHALPPFLLIFRSNIADPDDCFRISRDGGLWSLNGAKADVPFEPDVFHFVELGVDWVRQEATLTVNGEVVATSSFLKDCGVGMRLMAFGGSGWLDEVNLLCKEGELTCFGLAASDPGVCSGHGKCTANPDSPCVCDAGYGELDCRMLRGPETIFTFTFEQDMGTWVPQFMSGVVTGFSAAGGRSLRVGKVGSHDVGVSHVTLQEASRPRYITLRMAPMAGSVPTFLSFRDAEDRNKDCFYLGRRLDTWSVNGVKEFDFNPGVFHLVELDVDWVGKQVTLTVDRQVVGTSGFHSDCITGMGTMALFGGAWLDEVQMWSVKPL